MNKFDDFFMDVALRATKLSHCIRMQVGCVIAKNDSIISVGYNGQPAGGSNICEDEYNVTKHDTVHAEENALRHLMKSHESSIGATMYVTLQPCERCASMIIQSEIKKVYFHQEYRCSKGIDLLIKKGIEVIQL